MVGGVPDVITCAEFQIEIFMGYDFTGSRIFDFCIDFSMGLTTVQRYCAACDGTLIGTPTPGIQWYKFRPPGLTPNRVRRFLSNYFDLLLLLLLLLFKIQIKTRIRNTEKEPDKKLRKNI